MAKNESVGLISLLMLFVFSCTLPFKNSQKRIYQWIKNNTYTCDSILNFSHEELKFRFNWLKEKLPNVSEPLYEGQILIGWKEKPGAIKISQKTKICRNLITVL